MTNKYKSREKQSESVMNNLHEDSFIFLWVWSNPKLIFVQNYNTHKLMCIYEYVFAAWCAQQVAWNGE